MRVTPTRVVLALLISVFCFATWFIISQIFQETNIAQKCKNTEVFQDNLHRLAKEVHEVLSTLSLTHALCYGALWGQIRVSRTLPWENDVEFCLLNEELMLHDEAAIFGAFRRRKLLLSYDSVDGVYTAIDNAVTDPDLSRGSIKLVVFEEDSKTARVPGGRGMLRRVGWKRRVMPPDCEGIPFLECFPPNLVTPPLPTRLFGGVSLPVPHEGLEIQKYHYADNWWKEIIPKNC